MLKLVEIINTMPKRVCRVVLYAESKDDISQKALDEFQNKAEFTVAGGSFIYDSDKEISVTATDGLLLPVSKYSITKFISLATLREVGLTKEVDISGEITEFASWNTPGVKSVDFTDWDTINDVEMKRSCLDNLLGMSLENTGIGIKKVSELPDFIQQWEIQDDATFEAFIIPTTGSKSILLNVEEGNYKELFVADYSLNGLLKTMTVAEIKSAIAQGNAPEWYNVGKYKYGGANMSDTLALLALMKKGEGLTEEQVNQVIDSKNLQPKLTAGENITISADNVISATDTGLTQEQVNTLIDSKAISYNFKVNESNTDVGLRIVKDLWAGNLTNYNLTFNGEPVHKVYKDETNNKLVFTVLRVDYQNPSGPKLVGRIIIPTFENNEIVSYTVSGSNAGGQYTIGHTDAEINTLIDSKNLQPKLTAGTNITIDSNNVISSTDTGVSEERVNQLIDTKLGVIENGSY